MGLGWLQPTYSHPVTGDAYLQPPLSWWPPLKSLQFVNVSCMEGPKRTQYPGEVWPLDWALFTLPWVLLALLAAWAQGCSLLSSLPIRAHGPIHGIVPSQPCWSLPGRGRTVTQTLGKWSHPHSPPLRLDPVSAVGSYFSTLKLVAERRRTTAYREASTCLYFTVNLTVEMEIHSLLIVRAWPYAFLPQFCIRTLLHTWHTLLQCLWTWHTCPVSISMTISAPESGRIKSREGGLSRNASVSHSVSASILWSVHSSEHSSRKQKHVQWSDFSEVIKPEAKPTLNPIPVFF